MKASLPFAALGLGLLLLALSSLWPVLFSGKSAWTNEKAARWSEVQGRLHNLGPILNNPSRNVSMHGGGDYGQLKKEFDKLTAENDTLRAQFESAAVRPHSLARLFKWTGISLAALGLIAWYATNQSR